MNPDNQYQQFNSTNSMTNPKYTVFNSNQIQRPYPNNPQSSPLQFKLYEKREKQKPIDNQDKQIRQTYDAFQRHPYQRQGTNLSNNEIFTDNISIKRPLSQINKPTRSTYNPLTQPKDNNFKNSHIRNQFQQQPRSHNNYEGDKEQLRDQIKEKSKIVKELGNNKKFFEQQCKKKFKKYETQILTEMKVKVFESVLKKNLYYIYKHYETLKRGEPNANLSLDNNLSRVRQENEQIQQQNQQLIQENQALENKLRDAVLKIGIIKTTKEFIENINKEEIEKKIEFFNTEIRKMQQEQQELENKKKKDIYNIKMKYELEGRRQMEEKAIEIAMDTPQSADIEENRLKDQIRALQREIQMKEQLRNENFYYQKLKEKEALEKRNFFQQIIINEFQSISTNQKSY